MSFAGSVKLIDSKTAISLLARTPNAVPVDATWHMPNSPLNAWKQFTHEGRIPGSVFFDLDKVCDPASSYPHMLPHKKMFDDAMVQLGIRKGDPVLIYDRNGVFSGPRAAWTFTLFGHTDVYLLDHYPEYKSQAELDFSVLGDEWAPKSVELYEGIGESEYAAKYSAQVIEFSELKELVVSGKLTEKYHSFDARAYGRFTGRDPEPRKGLSLGHVPGSLSLPFPKVLTPEGHFKSRDELLLLFKSEFGLDLQKPLQKEGILVMCGTGVTAVILQTAIHKISPDIPVRVYDGSWTEWAQRAPELIEKS